VQAVGRSGGEVQFDQVKIESAENREEFSEALTEAG